MSERPAVGDKVRVTLESKVTQVESGGVWVAGQAAGFSGTYLPYTSAIEILERADDPANDPIGTVRRMRGRIFVKTDTPMYPWKRLSSEWKFSDPETLSGNMNTTMAGHHVIGVVPGSPADRD